MGLFISRQLAKLMASCVLLSKALLRRFFPMHIETMAYLVSRSGRELQRYDKGYRQVVGCIPYRYRECNQSSSSKEIEVLLISSQKKPELLLFPKGGWEIDESMEDAALRETIEEAGVIGNLEDSLGKWRYKGKTNGIHHEGYMFPLLVEKELDIWPEKNIRQRKWMTAYQAREVCRQEWMKEALDVLISLRADVPTE